MAISLVGTAAGSATDGSDITITLPSMLQDDLVCVWGAINTASADAGVTTSGYTENYDATVTTNSVSFSYKKMGVSPDTSVTCKGSGSSFDGAAYVVMIFRGVDTTTPIDATTVAFTNTTANPNSGSITTVTNGAAVISFASSVASDSAVTKPSGYSSQITKNSSSFGPITVAGSHTIVATAGAENPPEWTDWDAGRWIAATVALRPAVASTFGDAVFSFTGSGTATFIPASRFICTGTGTASWVGQTLSSNPAPFAMTGNASVAFEGYGSAQGPFDMTGSGLASFVGDRIYMSDVRLIIETGKAAVNIR